jgi:spore coat polysaccharide biosynthesis protein SpsF
MVRCDGGASLGMGHVSRGVAVADQLRDVHGAGVVFAMRDAESAGVAAVRARSYDVEVVAAREDADYGSSLAALVSSHNARAIVVDVRDALSRASLEAFRANGVRVVTIDDGSDRRLASDLAFYPPVPQVEEMDWAGFAGKRFAGWDWVLLKREFAAAESLAAPDHTIDILVTMGGSDPAGMTAFVVDALNLLPTPVAIEVVVGPAFGRPAALADTAARSRHAVRVSHRPEAMAPLMRASRLAVASFGVSAYELAACGVPTVHLCLSDDHARSASAFEREQIAVSLGVVGNVQPRQVADAVAGLLGDAGRRMKMAARARALVDGQGAARVARLVIECING